MGQLRLIAGLVCLVLLVPSVVGAAHPDAGLPATSETPALEADVGRVPPCAALASQSRQAVQTHCCEGHMGVCGCRAGKIVCCDATASRTCTCHAASPPDPVGSAVE